MIWQASGGVFSVGQPFAKSRRVVAAAFNKRKSLEIYQHLSLDAVEQTHHEAVYGVSI
jgi:hypothetical protein